VTGYLTGLKALTGVYWGVT